jgi:sterol desaturase/sphingolipid hydroxylase (fatty acid hydroxylase superfamily)
MNAQWTEARAPASDPLTASLSQVRPQASGPPTLRGCARAFATLAPVRLMAAAVALAVALRLLQGDWSWRDAAVPLIMLAAQPLAEWLTHRYVLHPEPIAIGRRRFDLPTAREHRAHHLDPANLPGALLPVDAMLMVLPLIAAMTWGLSYLFQAVLGGDRMALFAIALVCGYLLLVAYEWTHFLIHTPYRPRSRWYRSIWRSHRLHHYKNEHYWFGITSNVSDRLLGTFPDQSEVPRSPTARPR